MIRLYSKLDFIKQMFKMKRINFQKRDISSDNSHARCFISGGSNNMITHAFCQILAITGIKSTP